MSNRQLIIHGHFYQPPRENPWIEEIELQDSAAPYHDWNARVTAECYAPNSASRIVTDAGINDIVNNYEKISFNFGPTLLAYLDREAPSVYRKILEADRVSAARRGEGNAIAQAYNHIILPLASARDRRTQIRWGLADFRRRFGREPKGMWLPECAADVDSLVALADEGLAFTVLAPGQARRFRADGADRWHNGVDPRRPYWIALPGNRRLAIFFYDGMVAQDLAFGGALRDRDAFVDRLLGAYGDADPQRGPWLVHVATDGETFGHHKPFGDMVLAAAIERIEREKPAELTNYARFLAEHPPVHEVEIVSPSAWSCAHGVDRWREDCGCSTGAQPGWTQAWRRPLRDALDDLRDRLADVFEQRGERVFTDPWKARDAYVDVILDRTAESVDQLLATHAPRRLSAADRRLALELLEMERHAMLMYTSCGWFFSELSGTEGIQILKYAARALQLCRDVDGPNLEPAFEAALAKARCNIPEQGDGAQLLANRVRPSVVTLGGVVAHYAISSLWDEYPRSGRLFCFDYDVEDHVRKGRGLGSLAVGVIRLHALVTEESRHAVFAVVHFGGHDVRCAIETFSDRRSYDELKAELLALFEERSLHDVVRAIDRHFHGREFGLGDLFLDERRKIVGALLRDVAARNRPQLVGFFEENRALMRFLRAAETSVPGPLAAAAEFALSERLVALVNEGRPDSPRFDAITRELAELQRDAVGLGVTLDLAAPKRILEFRVAAEARELAAAPRRETARSLLAILDLAGSLGVKLDLWSAQNAFWGLTHEGPRGPDADAELMVRLGGKLGFDEAAIAAAWKKTELRNQLSA